MPFNLLIDPFFPVICRSGARRWLTFVELTGIEGDYPIDFGWPRPDFNIAAYEFAIGVTTLALQPLTQEDWGALWQAPPGPDAVQKKLAAFEDAFALGGEGPRFLQDIDPLEGKPTPIEALLIDTPGANGQEKNTDLLTHRARYPALGLPAAAMALYALQQFAPSGGAGNRTSLRGGGPLTTLVVPGAPADIPAPLWRVILANLVAQTDNRFDPATDLPRILPWLTNTLVSDKDHKGRKVNPTDPDAHPLQAFFGMPRRLNLVVEGEGTCPMTGRHGPLATGFVQTPSGVDYGDIWQHPLTPYRRLKEAAPPFSVKPKVGRFGYRDWVGVTIGTREGQLALPAGNVAAARHERVARLRGPGQTDARLRAGGWAMNNMEAITYLSAEQPLHLAKTASQADDLDKIGLGLVAAAEYVARLLRSALRTAHFEPGATVSTDTGLFADAQTLFYEATETGFHTSLDSLLDESQLSDAGLERANRAWLAEIARAARNAFATMAPVDLDNIKSAQRHATGYRLLDTALSGHGKAGKALFASFVPGLPLPQSKGKSEKTKPREVGA